MNNGRHELKHYINYADYMELRARLIHVAKPDENAADGWSLPAAAARLCNLGGKYKVRSLYFDNYADKVVAEKLAGLSRREKFRLRYYNDDTSFIRLEKKSKANRLCYKQSTMLTNNQCQEIINGNYSVLNTSGAPLPIELYAKMQFQLLRPRNIVDYTREAYVFGAGNVRITFDSDIRTSSSVTGFLTPGLSMIPSANAIILEIKFDHFLPEIIRDIVQIDSRRETEFSKYVISRLV